MIETKLQKHLFQPMQILWQEQNLITPSYYDIKIDKKYIHEWEKIAPNIITPQGINFFQVLSNLCQWNHDIGPYKLQLPERSFFR